MARPEWMDRYHEFRENIEDGSMCLCGVPALYHARWEADMLRDIIIDREVADYKRENHLT